MNMDTTIRLTNSKNIITKSDLPVCDYSANPYVGCAHGCMYCYASFMKRFTGHDDQWGSFVDVKTWPAIKDAARYDGKEIFLSSVTDPYQPAEGIYKRTRTLLEQLKGSGARLSISTKSDLVLRDLDLIKTFPGARVAWLVNTLDETFRADMDRASSIAARLNAMRIFHEEGVHTTCFISPIFPGITDVTAIIERVKGIADLVWLEDLNLRGSYRATVMDYISNRHPGLVPLYQEIYNKKDRTYWKELDATVATNAGNEGLEYVRASDSPTPPAKPPRLVNFFCHSQVKKSARMAENKTK